MKSIPVDSLRAGMIFDKPVYVDKENLFVPEEIPIKNSDLSRIKKWGILEVWTDGKPMQASVAAAGTLGGLYAEEGDDDLLKVYVLAVMKIDKLFNAVKSNGDLNTADLTKVVDSMTGLIQTRPYEMIAFTIRNESGATSLGKSAVNTMILATVIGLNMSIPPDQIKTLAYAALLHDIGMLKIPDYVLSKKSDLSPEDMKRIHAHPLYSYQIIVKLLKLSEDIAQIALQHQERWDGKGYPRKLAKENILLTARILSISDSFEAMIGDRPYRNSMIGYSAMRQILNDADRRFDPDILKVFIKSMGIYPMGSLVLLNDGSIGRVVSIHAAAPLRPSLKILVGKDGTKYANNEGVEIDLLKDKDLFIARAINPTTIGKSTS